MENNDMIQRKDIEGKYVFWDIDGTLAAYRFNGHLADLNGTGNGISLSEIENGLFRKRKPSKFMQKIVNNCGAKKNIIVGHYISEKEVEDKKIWLDEYYPIIKDRIFVFADYAKAEYILDYCKNNNIDLKDIIYVDDVLVFLKDAERKGINAWHISSFLDWEYNK